MKWLYTIYMGGCVQRENVCGSNWYNLPVSRPTKPSQHIHALSAEQGMQVQVAYCCRRSRAVSNIHSIAAHTRISQISTNSRFYIGVEKKKKKFSLRCSRDFFLGSFGVAVLFQWIQALRARRVSSANASRNLKRRVRGLQLSTEYEWRGAPLLSRRGAYSGVWREYSEKTRAKLATISVYFLFS